MDLQNYSTELKELIEARKSLVKDLKAEIKEVRQTSKQTISGLRDLKNQAEAEVEKLQTRLYDIEVELGFTKHNI